MRLHLFILFFFFSPNPSRITKIASSNGIQRSTFRLQFAVRTFFNRLDWENTKVPMAHEMKERQLNVPLRFFTHCDCAKYGRFNCD